MTSKRRLVAIWIAKVNLLDGGYYEGKIHKFYDTVSGKNEYDLVYIRTDIDGKVVLQESRTYSTLVKAKNAFKISFMGVRVKWERIMNNKKLQ